MLLPDPQVCRRYNIDQRTLPRWDANPGLKFPGPIYINGRKYRDVEALDEWDKWRAAGGGERRPLQGVLRKPSPKCLTRVKAEIAAAPSRDDAFSILCAAAFPALPDAERARALEEITGILAELPESVPCA